MGHCGWSPATLPASATTGSRPVVADSGSATDGKALVGQVEREVERAVLVTSARGLHDRLARATTSGNYKGDHSIRASVRGVAIGLLPAQNRAHNEAFLAAVESGERHGEAIISRFDERIGVKVLVESPA